MLKLDNVTDSVEEIRALSKVLLEVRDELRRVQEIEGMVPEDHVLLTIPGVGKLAGVILGVVEDIKRFPKPESFVTAWTLWWRGAVRR